MVTRAGHKPPRPPGRDGANPPYSCANARGAGGLGGGVRPVVAEHHVDSVAISDPEALMRNPGKRVSPLARPVGMGKRRGFSKSRRLGVTPCPTVGGWS